jgi:hypothetical protein
VQKKCEKYWPDDLGAMRYGNITVFSEKVLHLTLEARIVAHLNHARTHKAHFKRVRIRGRIHTHTHERTICRALAPVFLADRMYIRHARAIIEKVDETFAPDFVIRTFRVENEEGVSRKLTHFQYVVQILVVDCEVG